MSGGMSTVTKKETYFTAPSGRRYIVYGEKTLSEVESSAIFSRMKARFPDDEHHNVLQWKKEETMLLQWAVFTILT